MLSPHVTLVALQEMKFFIANLTQVGRFAVQHHVAYVVPLLQGLFTAHIALVSAFASVADLMTEVATRMQELLSAVLNLAPIQLRPTVFGHVNFKTVFIQRFTAMNARLWRIIFMHLFHMLLESVLPRKCHRTYRARQNPSMVIGVPLQSSRTTKYFTAYGTR